MSNLVWSPVYRVLEDRLRAGDSLILLVVPFIKVEALKQLLWATDKSPGLKVVVRWRPGDLIAGVTDLAIYPFLKERNIPLYFNRDIHLKLYAFESNIAFNTSGNLTLSGLGYTENSNIEVGNMVTLTSDDWQELFAIIDGSTQVDDDVHAKFKDALEKAPKPPLVEGHLPWPHFSRKVFTIQTFPATETPEKLIEYYQTCSLSNHTSEQLRRFAHDLALYRIVPGLTRTALKERLIDALQKNPFIIAFVLELQSRRSMSFGAVTEWIHTYCEDVPVPYRWEVKDSVRILYNWLQFAYSQITWDTPRHAQVIYWHQA